MKKILILGNGFDINDNMDTKFKDFAKQYSGIDFIIKRFIGEIDLVEYDFKYDEPTIESFIEKIHELYDSDIFPSEHNKLNNKLKKEISDYFKELYYKEWNKIEDILSEDMPEIVTKLEEFMNKNDMSDSANDNEGFFAYPNEPIIRNNEAIWGENNLVLPLKLNKELYKWIKAANDDSKLRCGSKGRQTNFWISKETWQSFDKIVNFNFTTNWIKAYGVDRDKVNFVHGTLEIEPRQQERKERVENYPKLGIDHDMYDYVDLEDREYGENPDWTLSLYDYCKNFNKINDAYALTMDNKEESLEVHIFGLSIGEQDEIYFKNLIKYHSEITWNIYESKIQQDNMEYFEDISKKLRGMYKKGADEISIIPHRE